MIVGDVDFDKSYEFDDAPVDGMSAKNVVVLYSYKLYKAMGPGRSLDLLSQYYMHRWSRYVKTPPVPGWQDRKIWTEEGFLNCAAGQDITHNTGDTPGCYSLYEGPARWAEQFEWDKLIAKGL